MGVALEAGGNEIVVGIALGASTGNAVVQAFCGGGQVLAAVEAQSGFADVDGAAEFGAAEEIRLLDAEMRTDGTGAGGLQGSLQGIGADSANFLRQAHFDQMTCVGALD